MAIRALGPTLLSAIMPLRLLSSVSGSYWILGEGISSLIEATGLLVVTVTAAAYLGHQVLRTRRATRRASTAAVATVGTTSCEMIAAGAAPEIAAKVSSTQA